MNIIERARELGRWGDVKYRSLMDANVYTPEQYAAGWEIDTSK